MAEKKSEYTTMAEAFLAAQMEMNSPALAGENPHFGNRFVPRDVVIAAVKPVLNKHGISITQAAERDGMMLRLYGYSDEWVFGPYPIPAITDPQKFMAACTYASRGQMMQVFVLAGDPDDDGNVASKAHDFVAELTTIREVAEDTGHKDALSKALGNPGSQKAALAIFSAMSEAERAKVAAVAAGTVEP